MSEISKEQIQTAALDHLGLVAAICQDLKIAQRMDDRLLCDSQRKISPGRAVIAMILNGLGFTNRRLYLTDQFLESKAIERSFLHALVQLSASAQKLNAIMEARGIQREIDSHSISPA